MNSRSAPSRSLLYPRVPRPGGLCVLKGDFDRASDVLTQGFGLMRGRDPILLFPFLAHGELSLLEEASAALESIDMRVLNSLSVCGKLSEAICGTGGNRGGGARARIGPMLGGGHYAWTGSPAHRPGSLRRLECA
jgi:hypothetical protein